MIYTNSGISKFYALLKLTRSRIIWKVLDGVYLERGATRTLISQALSECSAFKSRGALQNAPRITMDLRKHIEEVIARIRRVFRNQVPPAVTHSR